MIRSACGRSPLHGSIRGKFPKFVTTIPTNWKYLMRSNRCSVANVLGAVLYSGIIFAGLRSASNNWFKSIYSTTFLLLVYAAIAAKYRGSFWHGFALAGWAYFLIGFGPWIVAAGQPQPPGNVNGNLISSVILEITHGIIVDSTDTDYLGSQAQISMGHSSSAVPRRIDLIQANRNGIGHCALTLLFACTGGLVARSVEKRSRRIAESSTNEFPRGTR